MPPLNDLPPTADLVAKLMGIAGFPEPLEVRVSIRRTTTAEMTEESKQSAQLGADDKPALCVHHAANALTELSKLWLNRLSYWRSGGKEPNRDFLNQFLEECLAQHRESQWPIPSESPVQSHVDAFPKVDTQKEYQPRARHSQRAYDEFFKLTVVGEVGRGELTSSQAQQRYGIAGNSTISKWCQRYATHFAESQAAGPHCPTATPTANLTWEQRVEQLEIQLRQQKRDLG